MQRLPDASDEYRWYQEEQQLGKILKRYNFDSRTKPLEDNKSDLSTKG